ncbi:MAG: amino acid permease [Acidobacteriaceae bacterium]
MQPAQAKQTAVPQPGFARALSMRDGVAIVVGTVIGSGIFLVPGAIAMQLNSLWMVLLVWVVGGILSLFGALSLAELAAAWPGAGGLYVYLRQAYGRPIGFLYGWALLTMIQTGTIATLAAAFSLYLGKLLALTPLWAKFSGVACIAVLTLINILGVRSGKLVQNTIAICKVGGIALMVLLLFWRGHLSQLQSSLTAPFAGMTGTTTGTMTGSMTGTSPLLVSLGVALIAVLWAYEGWHMVSFTAAEFSNPMRDLPRSLLIGTSAIALIYLVCNLAYYAVLSTSALQATDRAAATAVSAAYGTGAIVAISLLILVSILGATNGAVLTGPRVYYAMGKDGVFLPQLAKLHPRFRTPVLALAVQGVWASVLTLLGNFQQLFTYVIFTAWIFYALTVAAVIVLRVKNPNVPRPYRVPFYPWLPLAFIAAAIGITLSTIMANPRNAAIGVGLILVGLPVYFIFSKLLSNRNESHSA